MLAPTDQRLLFQLARDAIRARLEGRAPPPLPSGGDPALRRISGVFVTLRKRGGELRGCVGHAIAQLPLVEAVRKLAVSAAFHDRRFQPLRPEEYDELELELSVLSPLEPITPAEVQVGRHGLVITRGGFSGLLLPQVATERGWTAEEFLAYTCRKAGLPPDAWQLEGTQLEAFTCDVYEEA